MVVLQIIFITIILVLIIATLNKKRIRLQLCKMNYHFHEKKKYRCTQCGKGQEHLKIVQSQTKYTKTY